MAYTKIHSIKCTVDKAISYITNPEKTDGKILVSSFACSEPTAHLEFEKTRTKFNYSGKNLAYHCIQSFSPDEVTPEQAHQIGIQTADELLKGKYEYVKEARHQGFVTGLENLSDIRRESLENKLHRTETKIDRLSADYSSPDISNKERLEIKKTIRSLKSKSADISAKIEGLNKLHNDLNDIKNGKFTESEIETTVNKTADKISESIAIPEPKFFFICICNYKLD